MGWDKIIISFMISLGLSSSRGKVEAFELSLQLIGEAIINIIGSNLELFRIIHVSRLWLGKVSLIKHRLSQVKIITPQISSSRYHEVLICWCVFAFGLRLTKSWTIIIQVLITHGIVRWWFVNVLIHADELF